ncbi:hypothetical protein EYC84_004546 [Monilinia fructicola]|uniref:Uncharacterized protein n=1 Tax=Monilinia fructicola TaxID=38448 RepID=A0A5M9K923_MONFR|nr:hypothetical protein EYC84_004546 [Monilinia fructicola]
MECRHVTKTLESLFLLNTMDLPEVSNCVRLELLWKFESISGIYFMYYRRVLVIQPRSNIWTPLRFFQYFKL